MSVSINKDQGLYVLDHGSGFSCLGFDVLLKRAKALAKELSLSFTGKRGTMDAYNAYQSLINVAQKKNESNGWRSVSELTPSLIGLEGKRVEGLHFGEKIRFYVGKSTGFIPIHLVIKTRYSTGGETISPCSFELLRIL